MNDIFISYSRYDSDVVNELVTLLEQEGYSIWIDRDGIESGEDFKRVILKAIKESKVVLFFSSEHSNISDWTAKEIGIAVKYKKHIIPVRLDKSNYNEAVEFDIINLDYIDYSNPSIQTAMREKLFKTLRKKIGLGSKRIERLETERKAEQERSEAQRKIELENANQLKVIDNPRPKPRRNLWVVIGAVAVVVLVALLAWLKRQKQENDGQEEKVYQACQTVTDYRAYLSEYGNSALHYADAMAFVAQYKADSIKQVRQADSISEAMQKAEAEQRARIDAEKKEDELYEKCTTVAACNKYLNDYPQGRYVDNVRAKKEQLEKKMVKGVFSISALKKVLFAKGNLQYQPSTNTWRFAENQWDYIGMDNNKVSVSYSGWIDLFGWGTSGWNSGNVYYHPWDTIEGTWDNDVSELYGPVGDHSLTGSCANADWGVFNRISNGGNIEGKWRALTQSEWHYLLFKRVTNSNILFVKAMVNDVKGIIILSDDWSPNCYDLFNVNNVYASYMDNTIMASEWNSIFETRAVFLPAAGSRSGTSIYDAGSCGRYWTTSHKGVRFATCLRFAKDEFEIIEGYYRSDGYSVRLVCPIE